jgi:hypothetical protein
MSNITVDIIFDHFLEKLGCLFVFTVIFCLNKIYHNTKVHRYRFRKIAGSLAFLDRQKTPRRRFFPNFAPILKGWVKGIVSRG